MAFPLHHSRFQLLDFVVSESSACRIISQVFHEAEGDSIQPIVDQVSLEALYVHNFLAIGSVARPSMVLF